jgi:hypothetical protein
VALMPSTASLRLGGAQRSPYLLVSCCSSTMVPRGSFGRDERRRSRDRRPAWQPA